MAEPEDQEVVNSEPAPTPPAPPVGPVLKIVDDWEQQYFSNESWPPHTKTHIAHAMKSLRDRIKGLVS